MDNSKVLEQLKRVLAQNLDRAAKAERIAKVIRTTGSYRWVGVYDVDVECGFVSNLGWDGPGPPKYPVFPITKGLTSRAIATGSTINVGDVTADADYPTALSTTRSEIIVPVLDKARSVVIGTIDVESERPHAFDVETQQLLERCADLLNEFWPTGDSRRRSDTAC